MNEKIMSLIEERKERSSETKDYMNLPGLLINMAIDDLESLLNKEENK